MNSELQNLWADALDETEDLVGETFTFNSQEIIGIINDLEVSSALNDMGGGFLSSYGTTVVARKELFSTVPKAGDLMIVRGTTVKIEKVSKDELTYSIVCIAPTK